MSEQLGFEDAVWIARGCHDYNGGHHEDDLREAFHGGIQTVVNALESVQKNGLDSQSGILWALGKALEKGKVQ